ncbi:hypothetical protein RF11_05934 [Thelohanellus kitauei]|uniref:Integrase zinc-binding domain-containing protein n=1 Tax=Thelohanellus kitauei TaxID=669202 RepID=A0A0C2J2F1_THEKT|nr:hypothetical protein RF11_05934 [Thelohanellus kitauei]
MRVRNDLSCENDYLLYKNRLVIHGELQKEILGILHQGRFGMVLMKQLARTCVYWPNTDAHIEAMSRSCPRCAEHQISLPKVENHPWDYPKEAWQTVYRPPH